MNIVYEIANFSNLKWWNYDLFAKVDAKVLQNTTKTQLSTVYVIFYMHGTNFAKFCEISDQL